MDILLTTTLPKPPPFLGDEDSAQLERFGIELEEPAPHIAQLTQSIPWYARAYLDDEYQAGTDLSHFGLDQEESPSTDVAARGLNLVEVFTPWNNFYYTDDEYGSSLLTPIVEIEQPPYYSTTTLPAPTQPFIDDEIGAQFKVFYIEDDMAWSGLSTTITWKPVLIGEDEIKVVDAAAIFDDELAAPDLRSSLREIVYNSSWWRRWINLVTTDDEILAPLANFYSEDELLSPVDASARGVGWISTLYTRLLTPISDDEILSYTHFELEEPSPTLVNYPVKVTWLPVVSTDDEALAPTPREQEEGSPTLSNLAVYTAWNASYYTDDEVSSHLGNLGYDQEEPWLAQYVKSVWDSTTFPYDETSAAFKSYGLGQEEPYSAVYVTSIWNNTYTTDDEICAPLAHVIIEQDELWYGLPSPPSTTISWLNTATLPDHPDETSTNLSISPREQEEPWSATYILVRWDRTTYTDDEVSAALGKFSLEDEIPPNSAQYTTSRVIVSWNNVYTANAEELYFVAAEDEPPFIAKVVVSQWSNIYFADDEITGSHLGKFGIDQEEPYTAVYVVTSWIPKPFSDDETTGSHLGNYALDQEDLSPVEARLGNRLVISWNSTFYTDDEVTGSPQGLGLEQEEPYVAFYSGISWNSTNFIDDEIYIVYVPPFTGPPTIMQDVYVPIVFIKGRAGG